MLAFTPLELAALNSIFEETPELAAALRSQLAVATVTERTNSGGGFFTTIAVPQSAARVDSPGVLGEETGAWVAGLEHGLGFVLFMNDGRLDTLEGYAYGESTSALSLDDLAPDVFRSPVHKIG
jgi:hypothetical protein